ICRLLFVSEEHYRRETPSITYSEYSTLSISGHCILIRVLCIRDQGVTPCSCSNLSGNRVYLNTNGSVKPEDGFATIGEIVRDRSIVIDQGYNNVQIQTDSLEVANAIQESPTGGSN
ncbi:hypothetical protein Golax_010711, partial [Gossypium laxum]|nr:hypothetical protein [Gossypium laxum]